MKSFWLSTTGQLSLGLVLVAGVFIAFAIGDDAGSGAVGAALVLAVLVVVLLGRRHSDTLDVMSGIGDERGNSSTRARWRSRAPSCPSSCRAGGSSPSPRATLTTR
jgi:hypothetical protein